jgi:hypothetical protein
MVTGKMLSGGQGEVGGRPSAGRTHHGADGSGCPLDPHQAGNGKQGMDDIEGVAGPTATGGWAALAPATGPAAANAATTVAAATKRLRVDMRYRAPLPGDSGRSAWRSVVTGDLSAYPEPIDT